MTDLAVPSGQGPQQILPRRLADQHRALANALVSGDTFYLLLPLIGNELGLCYVQIGSILTTQALCRRDLQHPGRACSSHSVGRKGLLMAISLFWIGAPYLLMGFSHDYWLLLTCAALVGIGNNLWHPTAIPLLAQRFPDRKGLAVSIHGMGGNVGDALAPFVAGALLAYLTWRQVVVVNVIPGIVMSVLLLRLSSAACGRSRAPRHGQAKPAPQALASATCCAISACCSTTACSSSCARARCSAP